MKPSDPLESVTTTGGNRPETAELSPNPQDEPVLVSSETGGTTGGLFVEDVRQEDGGLVVDGWSFGPVEFDVISENVSGPGECQRNERPDVGEAYSLESPAEIGFSLNLKCLTGEGPCVLRWRMDPSTEFRETPLRVTEAAAGATEATGPEGGRESEPTPGLRSESRGGEICIDFFAGREIIGWSFHRRSAAPLDVTLGGSCLGRITPSARREDVRDHYALEDSVMGFHAHLGGVLQFSLLSQDCKELRLSQETESPLSRTLAPNDFRDQLSSFSPLKSFDNKDCAETIGTLEDIRAINRHECVLLFRTARVESGDDSLLLDFYQEGQPGELTRVERCAPTRSGEVAHLNVRLLSIDAPVLVVVTNAQREILLTDLIPLASLYLPENAMLIEYHSVLASGQGYYDTAAKIARNFFVERWREAVDPVQAVASFPKRAHTAVILFDRQANDPLPEVELGRVKALFDTASVLGGDGKIIREDGAAMEWSAFLADESITHFVLLHRNASLRPDFWEILAQHAAAWNEKAGLIYGDSIVASELERPFLVKNSVLNHETFRRYEQAGLNCAIVTRRMLEAALERYPEDFAGAGLRLEHAFAGARPEELLYLRIVLDQSTAEIPTKIQSHFWNQQQPLPNSPAPAPPHRQEGGISVVINYRNALDETLRCLDSLSLQEFSGDLEVVLVDNQSAPFYSGQIVDHAENLFGKDAVQAISYDAPFDHSIQCNLGAEAARHPYLLMLSNDALLVSPNLLEEAREVTAVPWVGTCGFRIVGAGHDGKYGLMSLGLSCPGGPYLLAGGPVLGAARFPPFLQSSALEVAGNTFAAVCIRKSFYEELNGLDAEAFPTNYNDVDFCLRATTMGYRHVAIGSCVLEHVGRGTREIDLELPIKSRILKAVPSLDELSRHGVFQL